MSKKAQPPVKPLSPLQAERKLAALERLYNENMEITDREYVRLRDEILKRLVTSTEDL